MPIMNQYRNTNAGQNFMPEMACAPNPMAQASQSSAIVNMGGNAVTGYSVRYTSIGELNAQAQGFMPAEMGMAQPFSPHAQGSAQGCSRANPFMSR